MIALVVGGYSHFFVNVPLINDEALELSQGVRMRLDSFHFLSPTEIYLWGNADQIETLVPYVSAWLAHVGWGGDVDRDYVRLIHLVFLLAYAAGTLFFALTLRSLLGRGWAFVGGLIFACSAFVLITNHIVTRNGISLLWATAITGTVVKWADETAPGSRTTKWFLPAGLALLLVMGCWTYTSFRMLSLAVFLTLALDFLQFDRTLRGVARLAAAGAMFGGLMVVLIEWDGSSLQSFLQRGSYAVGDSSGYLRRLAFSFISPWHYVSPAESFFVIEDVHVAIGRAPLSPILAPFFVLGCLTSWGCSCRAVRLVAKLWLIGMVCCAVAGPNLKYLVVFFPATLCLTVFGLQRAAHALGQLRVRRWLALALVASVIACALAGEVSDYLFRFPYTERQKLNRIPARMAETAVKLLQEGYAKVYVQPGLGFDIVVWYLEHDRALRGRPVEFYFSLANLREAMTQEPPPPQSVLLIDYPAAEIPRLTQGWSPPSGVFVLEEDRSP